MQMMAMASALSEYLDGKGPLCLICVWIGKTQFVVDCITSVYVQLQVIIEYQRTRLERTYFYMFS